MSYTKEITVAKIATANAAYSCMRVQAELVGKNLIKKDDSPVTVADFASQAIICQKLKEQFPHDRIVGEASSQQLKRDNNLLSQVSEFVQEIYPGATRKDVLAWIDSGNSKGGKGRFWTLNPVDGFIHKEQYAVALALVEDGKAKAGVLVCPSFPHDESNKEKGIIFSAVQGEGMQAIAIANSEKISPLEKPIYRLVKRNASSPEDQLQTKIAIKAGLPLPPLKMDSQAKYGALALGRGALYVRFGGSNKKIWDHAAGTIILEESGGKVTDSNGKPLDFSKGTMLSDNKIVVATNRGFDHDKVISAINSSLTPSG